MLGNHKNIVLQFSGGKDSTALMYLSRPYLDRITVLFSETGATFPHLKRHVKKVCRDLDANLVVVLPAQDVHQHIKEYGLPVDIVPVESSSMVARYLNLKPKQLVQPYTQCCGAMIWYPMQEYVKNHNVDLVLRGSKAADGRVGVTNDAEIDGVTYRSPLWDWSDADVYAYLKEQGVSLPEHYPRINDSLDCWCCTAHLAHHGAEKMKYIKENYPELWPIVSERLGKVRDVLASEMERIRGALNTHD